jgi:hypothetical protein
MVEDLHPLCKIARRALHNDANVMFQHLYLMDCFERIIEESKWLDTGE